MKENGELGSVMQNVLQLIFSDFFFFFFKVWSTASMEPNTGLELTTLRLRTELRLRLRCLMDWALFFVIL